jgi:hypothetical protein
VWTVTDVVPERLFAWQTKLGPVTVRAVHQIDATDGGCRNTLKVDLIGFGSGVLRTIGGRRLVKAITTENLGFKRAAEAAAASGD